MQKQFQEYYTSRALEDFLLENIDVEENEQGLVKNFISSLGQYLPDGLQSVSGVIDKLKDYVRELIIPNFKISADELQGEPDEKLVNIAMKQLGNREKINDEEAREAIKYDLKLYNNQLKQHLQPGAQIGSKSYFKHFKNLKLRGELGNLGSVLQINQGQDGSKKAIGQAAIHIKSQTNDPQVHQAVDRALADVLTDNEIREIELIWKGNKAGKQKVSDRLQKYGKDYQDYRQEVETNPDFRKRVKQAQKDRKKQMGKFYRGGQFIRPSGAIEKPPSN